MFIVIDDEEGLLMFSFYKEYENEDSDELGECYLEFFYVCGIWMKKIVFVVFLRVWFYVIVVYKVVDCIILFFGFIVLIIGIVILGRFFVSYIFLNVELNCID